ncbi:MAG: TlpA family protein disulfide reductase [Pedobacter sp.]|nr:MAG: TlpA family protein disulfide reductase [Pedobacter sp.]
MKYKIKMYVLLALLAIQWQTKATEKKVGQTVISGKLGNGMERFEGGEFSFDVYDQNASARLKTFTSQIKCTIKDKRFTISVPNNEPYVYASISLVDREGNSTIFNSNYGDVTPLLYKLGDSLNMTLFTGGLIEFLGNSASLPSCQQNIYLAGNMPLGALECGIMLRRERRFQAAFDLHYRFLYIQFQTGLQIMEGYKNQLSKYEIDLITIDLKSKLYCDAFKSIYNGSFRMPSSINQQAKGFIYKTRDELKSFKNNPTSLHSIYFGKAFLLNEMAGLSTSYGTDGSYQLSFQELTDSITAHYSGELRSKILMNSFLDGLTKSMRGRTSLYNQVVKVMDNGPSKKMLASYIEKTLDKAKAFAFDLPNPEGIRHRLEHYEGKVIIADFWFTGCHGCVGMTPALRKVYEKFNNNKNIVWLSINITNTMDSWKKGLESGDYTFPGQIHLSTIGNGFAHPLLKHYNYSSFPSLLIIDQSGKTIATYPPDPRFDGGKGLEKLIDSLL